MGMRITIQFNTDNAAFEDFDGEVDAMLERAKRVIYRMAYASYEPMSETSLRDTNGNTVGKVTLEVTAPAG